MIQSKLSLPTRVRMVLAMMLVLGALSEVRDAGAQVLTKVGSFAASTGGGPPLDQAVTGVGFQPKAVIFFWTRQTGAGGFNFSPSFGYGFATGPANEAAIAGTSTHNEGLNSSAGRWQSQSRCIVVTNSRAAATSNAEAELKSMDANGFTLTWQKVATSAWVIHYLAIGGDDVRIASVGSFTPLAGTGSEDIDIGFDPDFLMFLSIDSNSVDTMLDHAKPSLGFVSQSTTGVISRAAVTAALKHNQALGSGQKTFVRQSAALAILEKDVTLNGDQAVYDVTAFNAGPAPPPGFTIDKQVNANPTVIHYLALKGGRFDVGAFAKPATDTPPNAPFATSETGIGFQPRALLFASKNILTSPGGNQEGRISFSAADEAGNEGATFFHDKNVASPTDSSMGFSTSKVVFLAQENCLSGTPACDDSAQAISEADVSSMDADGFTLDWTLNETSNPPLNDPANENNAEILYVAFGNGPPRPVARSIGSYSFGNASMIRPPPTSTVTFAGGASLPAWVAPIAGERVTTITLEPGTANEEPFTISSRNSATQLTTTANNSISHSAVPYTIAWRYERGTAAVAQYATTVTFGGGASLPTDPLVGRGDKLTLDPGGPNEEILFIESRVSATEVEVQSPALQDHSGGESYRIERAYTTLGDWEAARQGDLVAGNRVEVGLAYNDGEFTSGLTIDGSTTDATRYMILTVAPGQRHSGIAGTGVVLDGQDTPNARVEILDDYAHFEWFEVERVRGSWASQHVIDVGAQNVELSHLIVHDFDDAVNTGNDGISIKEGGTTEFWSLTVRNSLVYDGQHRCIQADRSDDALTVENTTVYGCQEGVSQDQGSAVNAFNTISMNNGTGDFDVSAGGSWSNNISQDGSEPGAGSFQVMDPTTLFVNTAAGDEANWDFHLIAGATALDTGTTLSTQAATDIDAQKRPKGAQWDIGADERLAGGLCPVATAGWYDGNWQARKAVVIDSALVTGVLTDFPVLVRRASDTELAASAQNDGDDILFTASDGMTKLSHEIEKFDGGTGELLAWVKIPYLSSGADTVIYMYYGHGTVASQQDAANVWDANFRGVWHLKENPTDPAPQFVDSTANPNDGTANTAPNLPSQAAGKIDGSLSFNDTLERHVNVPDHTSLQLATDITLSAWIKIDDPLADNDVAVVVSKWSDPPNPPLSKNYWLGKLNNDNYAFFPNRTNSAQCGTFNSCPTTWADLIDGQWHYLVGVADSSGGGFVRLYTDGQQVMSSGYSGTSEPGTSSLHIGNSSDAVGGGQEWNGGVDEVRVSSVVRSSEWIATEFNNQNDPSAFCTVCAAATTAVKLIAFDASGGDGIVELRWETGSEMRNLGFHLYRSISERGPYARITSEPIPGLGSSPEGARYTYRDQGLTNGTTYYYQLEDIETTGRTELHGPVSATPTEGATARGDGGPGSGDPAGATEATTPGGPRAWLTYGNPSPRGLRIVRRTGDLLVLELETGGFYATLQEDGSVDLSAPGLIDSSEPGASSIPVHRSWIDVAAGRNVELVSVEATGVESFPHLRPTVRGLRRIVSTSRGTVHLTSRKARAETVFRQGGLYPSQAARIVDVGFQGGAKKAFVELAPLRWDAGSGRLLLARRLEVHLAFRGQDEAEITVGGTRGRRARKRSGHRGRNLVARLVTVEKGLYGIRFEDVFQARSRGIRAASLRLSRLGETVPFHVEPLGSESFGPGTTLYFLSEGGAANPYGREAVYELDLSEGGALMESASAVPSGSATSSYWRHQVYEKNRYYQAGLVAREDPWLWDVLVAPMTKSYPFELPALTEVSEPARLGVWLQGLSDLDADPDHHIRLYVNGSMVAETSWDGQHEIGLEVELLPGVLREGENRLEIESVKDTEALYSLMMLDRFTIDYPHALTAHAGIVEGRFTESGIAAIAGLRGAVHVLDLTEGAPRWLTGVRRMGDVAELRVEAGRTYRVVSTEAVRAPEVRRVASTGLESESRGADYLVIGPRSFLDEAAPLLEYRRNEGLRVKAAAIEDVYDEFGYGEARPEAVRDFLTYAYHHWPAPSPRYVVLLGDGTYDFKDYLQTGVVNRVPPLMVRTSYLWTSSDPMLAAVHGGDVLPDLAIGRLPAATEEEARVMVAKILAFETGRAGLSSPVVLVADNPDRAGNFVADAEEISQEVLGERDLRKIYLSELGTAATRSEIREAFDEGASLVSYMGHGGIALWADENIFHVDDVPSLALQAQQPLFVTMNCLNGYFHFPYFNSLSEELLKAEGKGAVAAFSPSGMSLNEPAHRYHRALLDAIFRQGHLRLGDAVLAAQAAYASTGGFPELLSIYHLFGDPALRLK